MKNEKKKIRTQNIHEFRSSFILNMNKKEYKSRKFNHNNTNLEKKITDKKLFLHFLILITRHKLPAKTSNQTPPKPATHTHTHTHTQKLWRFGHGGTPIPNLPWTSHPKPYLLCLQLRLWFDFPCVSHIAKLCSSCPGFFCFCFFERMWSFLILWVYCVFVSQENFWIYGFARDLVSYCVCFPKFLCKSIFVAFL